jgi:precorrin-4 methylase
MTAELDPMRDHSPGADPVARARNGDEQAWDALVERYAPLTWSAPGWASRPGASAQTAAAACKSCAATRRSPP